MAQKRNKRTAEDLLQDLLIVQLGLAGLGQHQIREIVGVDMNRVTRILKHFKILRKEASQ
jgi:hypothetical protein